MTKKNYFIYTLFTCCFLFFAFDSFGPRTDGGSSSTTDFVNFETPHVHPIDITPNGQKLLSVNTADNRLEVWQVTGSGITHLGSIPVGMDPVTVRARSNSEAWVVNHLSDNVSIVDLNTNIVTRILRTDNEPCDVVFGGSPQKAFVSCSEANTLNIFQLNNLNATPQKIRIIGEEPRAMAVSPDGNTVYTAFFESGNQTTIVPGGKGEGFQGGRAEDAVRHPAGPYGGVDVPPNNGSTFSPPINPALPPPPPTSMIIKKNSSGQWLDDNNGDWTPFISGSLANESHRVPGWDLPDRDVVVMNANSFSVSYQRSLMNIQMAMAVNPSNGRVAVVGTDATNEIRFEPNIKGKFMRVNFASFTSGSNNTITDMNPHLNYNQPNISQSLRNQSVADPRGIAWNSSGTRCYVTGMGTNNVIILNSNGDRVQQQPIEVGEGPTGIVLDENNDRAFVLNKFDGTISIVNINSATEISRVSFYDPTPQVIKDGRPHLYDAHATSGLGNISCASCHVDARFDGLAWDLGNPQGELTFPAPGTPTEGAPFNGFHPMKGPMRTSPLQDIINHPSMHWRGDREDIFDFAEAYETLQGDDSAKPTNEMQQLENFLNTIHFPPNPYRNLDNSIANAVPIFGPNNTILRFANPLNAITEFQSACLPCHPGQRGRSNRLVENFLHVNTHQVPETFRGFYERSGFFSNTTDGNTSGYGKLPDGSEFFDISQMDISQQRNDEFHVLLMSFDGGVPWASPNDHPSQDAHAAVGQQVVVNGGISGADQNLLNQFLSFANSNAVGLIAKGLYEGEYRGFSYTGSNNYQSDKASQIVDHNDLMSEALNNGPITFTVVPLNAKTRMGIDRDSDNILDWDEDGSSNSQAINFPTILDKLTTDPDFQINATASSGLPVDFELLSGPATLSGNTVSLTGQVGTVSIRATQGGNSEFDPAPPVTRSFNVSQDNPGECNTVVNLALNKSASQSSTVFGAVASRANDGNVNGNFLSNSVAATDNETNPWWQADLGEVGNIEDIEIWNRTDNRQDRLSNFYLLVSDVPFVSNNLNTILNQSGVSSFFNSEQAGSPTTIAVNRTGRYVRIQLNYAEHLTVAEVKVMGCTDVNCLPAGTPCDDGDPNTENDVEDGNCNCAGTPIQCPPPGTPCDDGNPNTENDVEDGNCNCAGTPINTGECTSVSNLALNKPASQSSTVFGAVASRANDGNVNGNFLSNSVAATDNETNPWWQVDLGEVANIEDIEIWNRTDNRQDRLSNFYLLVSEVPFVSNNLNTILNQSGVSSFFNSAQAGSPTTITVNRTGRYVRIQLNYAEHLTIAEVKVMGCSNENCLPAGTPCDDGDPNTENDVEDGNCNCAGTPIQCPPSGTPCDDGDPNTENDVEDGNCNCEGTPINIGSYCDADGDFPWEDWISNVSVGNLENSSGKSEYSDFTSLSANLSKGNSYTISVENSFSYLLNYSVYSRVWIDFNNDKVFSNSELVLSVDRTNLPNGTVDDVVSENFTVPISAATGATRMRVILSKDSPLSSCGTVDFGEVEDYAISINNNAAATNRVALLELTAAATHRQASLNWVTNESYQADHFIIERSSENADFKAIETVDEIKSPSLNYRSFNFIDVAPMDGINTYRIAQVLFDGTVRYSNVQELHFATMKELTVFPNPASDQTFIDLTKYARKSVHLKIYSVKGKLMAERHLTKVSETSVRIDTENFENGIYFIHIKAEGHRAITKKLVVSRMY